MYPNQDPQQPYSIDYLNQIAPQAPKKGLAVNMRLIIAILAGVLLLAIGMMVFGSLNKEPNTSELLAARLKETATISKSSQKNLKSIKLRSINTNLTIYLTNTNRDLATHLASSGLSADKLSQSVIKSEAANAKIMTDNLEEARLNAMYDRTYSREMAYLLETIGAYMKSAYSKTSSSSYKEFLTKAYEELSPIQKQFAEYNESSQ